MTTISIAKPRHARGAGRSKFIALLAAVASIFVLAACHFVGSGTVVSSTGQGKATFTFDLNCPNNGTATGVLTYVDTPAKVSVHAFVPGTLKPTSCNTRTVTGDGLAAQPNLVSGPSTFYGTYTPLKPGTGGTFSLTVAPGGTAQAPWPGWFCIAFYGGVYDSYTNAGTIQWGNIVSA